MGDVAIGAISATGITVLISVLMLAIKAYDARSDAGDARVDAEHVRGELAIALADVKTWQTEATAEKARADALYKELTDADAHAPDPAAARAAVLQRWQQAHAARPAVAGPAGPVLVGPATPASGP